VEFALHGPQGYTAYYVDEEGTLISLNELEQQQAALPAENLLV